MCSVQKAGFRQFPAMWRVHLCRSHYFIDHSGQGSKQLASISFGTWWLTLWRPWHQIYRYRVQTASACEQMWEDWEVHLECNSEPFGTIQNLELLLHWRSMQWHGAPQSLGNQRFQVRIQTKQDKTRRPEENLGIPGKEMMEMMEKWKLQSKESKESKESKAQVSVSAKLQ